MKQTLSYLIVIAVFALLPSCRVLYPNVMFKQKDYQFYELAQKQIDQYVIQPGDELSIRVYSREGFRLVDVLGGQSVNGATSSGASIQVTAGMASYVVDNEGFARIPVIGEMFVKGYTEKELQRVLADKFAGLFVDPFVVAKVENRRALVFKGSSATVVSLNAAPTNLLEVIAKAGGLGPMSKAYNIKVIRGDIKNPQVMLIDLSTLEGVRKADLIVQSNDIIYIDEKRQSAASTILLELTPYLSLLTTVATVIILAKSFGKL